MKDQKIVQDVPLGHLITVATGWPLCTTGQGGMIALFKYLAQYPLVGPTLNMFSPIARYAVVRQHIWLMKVKMPRPELFQQGDWATLWAWLDRAEDALGAAHPLSPASDQDWRQYGRRRGAPRALRPDGTRWHFDFEDPDPASWLLTGPEQFFLPK